MFLLKLIAVEMSNPILNWYQQLDGLVGKGRLVFEDGLRSGGPLHCVAHCSSVFTNLADIMDTLKKFKVAMLSQEVGC